MPISMNNLLQKMDKATGEFHGDSWEVSYYPHRISDDVWAKMAEFRRSEGFDALNEVLAYLIGDWDFVYDASRGLEPGNKVPITAEMLKDFPTLLKTDIATAIMESVTGPKSSNTSSSTSSLTGSSGNAPNGSLSSRPANISELHPGRLLGPITQPATLPGENGPS